MVGAVKLRRALLSVAVLNRHVAASTKPISLSPLRNGVLTPHPANQRRGIQPGCCARGASGHAAAPNPAMSSVSAARARLCPRNLVTMAWNIKRMYALSLS
jgi:hypothetical protein